MDATIVYSLIGLIHIIGFVVLLATVKLTFKKTITTEKLMGIYIIIFLLCLLIISIYGILFGSVIISDIGGFIGATIGELVGLGIGFFIVDSIIIWIGRKVFYRNRTDRR